MILIWAFWSISSTLARQNAIQTELAAAGLQEVGHPMLMCILHTAGARGADGQTQRELAQLLHVSPAAVATSLKSLEKKGYICREPEPGDARRNRVTLTDKGQRRWMTASPASSG